MKVKARANGLKVTPRKIGLVAGLVRRRSVKDGLTILEHAPQKAARMLADVIKSAVANAEHNHKLNTDNLWIESIMVGPGPVMKRYKPVPMGGVHMVKKRSSNVTVVVEDFGPGKNTNAMKQQKPVKAGSKK